MSLATTGLRHLSWDPSKTSWTSTTGEFLMFLPNKNSTSTLLLHDWYDVHFLFNVVLIGISPHARQPCILYTLEETIRELLNDTFKILSRITVTRDSSSASTFTDAKEGTIFRFGYCTPSISHDLDIKMYYRRLYDGGFIEFVGGYEEHTAAVRADPGGTVAYVTSMSRMSLLDDIDMGLFQARRWNSNDLFLFTVECLVLYRSPLQTPLAWDSRRIRSCCPWSTTTSQR